MPLPTMRIAIIHDHIPPNARADEADARVQADAVSSALRELGHDSSIIEATLDLEALKSKLLSQKPDVVFNLAESLGSQSRLIHLVPGLLETLGIPFTGASAEAQFATSNKLIAKQIMRGANLATPCWHALNDLHSRNVKVLPSRYIIKSVWEHASLGLDDNSIVEAETPWQLREAVENRCAALGGEAFAEQFIDGREFNLALLATSHNDFPQVLPPAEIIFEDHKPDQLKIVGYRAKWDQQSFEYNHTPRRYQFAPSDDALLETLSQLSVECWQTFDLHGYARVDFRVDQEGRPWILEINANPCLSPDAGFAAALERAGIAFPHAIQRILDDALRSQAKSPSVAGNELSRT